MSRNQFPTVNEEQLYVQDPRTAEAEGGGKHHVGLSSGKWASGNRVLSKVWRVILLVDLKNLVRKELDGLCLTALGHPFCFLPACPKLP